MASIGHDAQFVDDHSSELIQRVTNVMALADELLSKGMLHNEAYSEIMAQSTKQSKMRLIFETVDKVDQKKYVLYTLLQKIEPHLMKELESNTGTQMKRLLPSTSGASSEIQEKRGRFPGQTISEYKERLCTKYETFQEYNSLLGQQVPLTARYTKLLIVQRHRKKEEKEEELRSRGQEHSEVLSSRCGKDGSSTSVEQLFHPDDRGRIPKAVILQGESGHGKSFTVQKIVHDWACGNLFQSQFELVLHLKCKELNLLSGEKNVMQLLDCGSEFVPLIEEMLSKTPQKVLFIIDGFDELKFSLDNNTMSPPDAFTPAPVEATLSALLKGRILHKSFLLVTTRSTASDKLNKFYRKTDQALYPMRFTEILGFSEAAVKDYFQRFFIHPQLSDEMYKNVKADIMLSTACSIPVICWIVCTTFREQYEDSKGNMKGLETTTSIFLQFVSLLLNHHCQGLNQPAITLLRSLAKLAERGILKKQVLFEEKCVLEVATAPTSVPFLCKFLRQKKIEVETMFSFMHLSFQEFFTALHYFITDNEKIQIKLENRLPRHRYTYNPEVVERLNIYCSGFLSVIPFLFGLSNREVTTLIMQHYNISVSPSIRASLEEWMQHMLYHTQDSHEYGPPDYDFLLNCLYELHDEQFVQKAMKSMGFIDLYGYVSDITCWRLRYCILCCHHIDGFDISVNTIEKLKMLQPALPRCEKLRLTLCNLEDADVDSLISALEKAKVVTKLRIITSNLSEKSLLQILTLMTNQHSLEHISLSAKTITSSVVAALLKCVHNKNINEAQLMSCDEDSCCSSLSISKHGCCKYMYMMTAGYPDIYTRNEIVGNTCIETYTPKNSMEPDPILCLFFSECTETSGTDWIGILQRFHTLKRLTQSSPEFPVEMEALLSSLRSTPHLAALRLKVTCLDMSWAVWTLSLPHTCPGLKDIVVAEAVCDDERSVCTYISTEESNHNTSTRYMYFSDLWLQQHPEKYPFYDEFSDVFFEIVTPPPHAVISSISFTLRQSPEIFSFNWKDFLMNLHLMKNKDSPTFDEHQGALLTSLHSLPIKQLSIERLCLTDTWTQGIVSLIQTCLSIEKLHLTASCSGHSLMNAVQLLQKSNIRSDCTLVVVGCRKCTDQCTENKHLSCNQKMKITINGKYVKMERIYPDDDYYPDDEPDIPDPIFYLGVDNWETEDEQDGDEDAG